MIRQAAVAGLSLLPFGLSISAAYIAWDAFPSIEGWHIVVTVFVWIGTFAVGTQIFWKGVERLASKR
ncbi:MAG TPA: hypothetical protein VGR56_01925 [Nitrososphaerales archaeon]|nr:hypothetical protein [Nitrososphaerales archaeon]